MINAEEKSMQMELEAKLEEAMGYLKIPDSGAVITKVGVRREVDNFPADRSPGHYTKRLHQIRAGLYAVVIMDFLGIDNMEWRHTIFGAFVGHDRGQKHLSHLLDRDKLSNAEMKEMSRHIEPEYLGTLFNPVATAIAERHHKTHRLYRSYPEKPRTPETPEVAFWSYVICNEDTYDSASTRLNKSTHFSWTDRIMGKQLPSAETIRKRLIVDQGEAVWRYEGDMMYPLILTGEDFINLMYNENFFGQEKIEDRINPYRNTTFGRTPRL